MLYQLPGGLFAELSYDTEANHITHLRSFTSSAPLEDYGADGMDRKGTAAFDQQGFV